MPNYFIVDGRLTRDPDLKKDSKPSQCNFTVAYNGQDTVFLDCVCYGRTAENLAEYTAKGTHLLIEGYFAMEEVIDKRNGKKRSRMRLIAAKVQFLDSRERKDTERDSGGPVYMTRQQYAETYNSRQEDPPPPETPETAGTPPQEDDYPAADLSDIPDIPF